MTVSILHTTLFELLSFTISYSLILAVPGSNFLLVSSVSMNSGRRSALTAALGVGLGACILCCSIAFGAERLSGIESVRRLIAVLFAGQLLWLALKSYQRGRAAELPWRQSAAAGTNQFRVALFTGLLNPTTAIFFALPRPIFQLSPLLVFIAAAIVFSVATAWFSLVAMLTSMAGKQMMSLTAYRSINLFFAAAFVLLATMAICSGLKT